MYDVDYFIDKFEAIPDEKWGVGRLADERGCKCALGHCGVLKQEGKWIETEESKALGELFIDNLIGFGSIDSEFVRFHVVYEINDDVKKENTTPKSRILSALNMIKEKEMVN